MSLELTLKQPTKHTLLHERSKCTQSVREKGKTEKEREKEKKERKKGSMYSFLSSFPLVEWLALFVWLLHS